jgi:hypothetical protein
MKYKNNKIKYEVGDLLIATKTLKMDGTNEVAYKEGKVYPVTYFNGYSLCILDEKGNDLHGIDYPADKENGWLQYFRPATEQEIEKNTDIFVGEYKVHFFEFPNDNGAIITLKIGCETIEKDLFLKIGRRAGWL